MLRGLSRGRANVAVVPHSLVPERPQTLTKRQLLPQTRRQGTPLVVAAALSAAIGYVDIITGEIRLTTLYLTVISTVTWLSGLLIGLVFCAAELGIMVYANRVAGPISLDTVSFYLELSGDGVLFVVGVLAVDRLRHDYRTALLHRVNLARYLPERMRDKLAEVGLGATADRHDAAIMFVDLRGFTPFSRRLGPQALFTLLHDYRREVAAAVDAHGGLVDKFIGDGVLVVFGAERKALDDAARAVACAEDIVRRLEAWRARHQAGGKTPPGFGIGVHWGEVLAGALGDEHRLEYTVIGDTVNVAARIEKLTRRLGVPLLISEAALTASGRSDWYCAMARDVPGLTEPLPVFSPTPFPGPAPAES